MRTRHSVILAAVGLLAVSGTAAADPGQFSFGLFVGAPAPVYVAPPAPPVHYWPPVHAAPHAYVAPAPAHHGERYVEHRAFRDSHHAREAHGRSHRGGHGW